MIYVLMVQEPNSNCYVHRAFSNEIAAVNAMRQFGNIQVWADCLEIEDPYKEYCVEAMNKMVYIVVIQEFDGITYCHRAFASRKEALKAAKYYSKLDGTQAWVETLEIENDFSEVVYTYCTEVANESL